MVVFQFSGFASKRAFCCDLFFNSLLRYNRHNPPIPPNPPCFQELQQKQNRVALAGDDDVRVPTHPSSILTGHFTPQLTSCSVDVKASALP